MGHLMTHPIYNQETKMKQQYLDILDLMDINTPIELKRELIDHITQHELYQISSWLMMYLTPESRGTEHLRSQIRDALAYYYEQVYIFKKSAPWSDASKRFVGYATINLWKYRQLEQDPRMLKAY